MQVFLQQVADQILISEDSLARLYAIKGPLSGALAGCKEAIHLETGKRSAVRETSFHELSRSRRKRDELHSAVVAMRHIANQHHIGGEGGGHDASSSSPLPLLTEVIATTSRVLVFFELEALMRHDGGLVIDMLSLIEKRGRIKEDDTKQMFAKLVLAVKAAHDLGIVLRNIKPETIQLSQEMKGKPWTAHLVDLHCAAMVEDINDEQGSLTGLSGTPEYVAPEVAIWYWHEQGTYRDPSGGDAAPPPYGVKADIWSLGMCLHVMLCGCFPFKTDRGVDELLRDVNAAHFTFDDPGWAKLSPAALELVEALLVRDPADRPCLEEVLQHPFCMGEVNRAVEHTREDALKEGDFDTALALLDD